MKLGVVLKNHKDFRWKIKSGEMIKKVRQLHPIIIQIMNLEESNWALLAVLENGKIFLIENRIKINPIQIMRIILILISIQNKTNRQFLQNSKIKKYFLKLIFLIFLQI